MAAPKNTIALFQWGNDEVAKNETDGSTYQASGTKAEIVIINNRGTIKNNRFKGGSRIAMSNATCRPTSVIDSNEILEEGRISLSDFGGKVAGCFIAGGSAIDSSFSDITFERLTLKENSSVSTSESSLVASTGNFITSTLFASIINSTGDIKGLNLTNHSFRNSTFNIVEGSMELSSFDIENSTLNISKLPNELLVSNISQLSIKRSTVTFEDLLDGANYFGFNIQDSIFAFITPVTVQTLSDITLTEGSTFSSNNCDGDIANVYLRKSILNADDLGAALNNIVLDKSTLTINGTIGDIINTHLISSKITAIFTSGSMSGIVFTGVEYTIKPTEDIAAPVNVHPFLHHVSAKSSTLVGEADITGGGVIDLSTVPKYWGEIRLTSSNGTESISGFTSTIGDVYYRPVKLRNGYNPLNVTIINDNISGNTLIGGLNATLADQIDWIVFEYDGLSTYRESYRSIH